MKINYMREFIMVVDNLNITSTAGQLFITQPALSRHIALVEETIGAQLLVRSNRTFYLTPIGQQVYDEFKKILEQYDALVSRAAMYSTGLVGELKIGMLYYSINELITPTVELFKAAYPNIKLHYFSSQLHQIISGLLNNQIDVGPVVKFNFPNSDQLVFSDPIYRNRFAVMLSSSHPLAERKSVRLHELADETLILLESESEITINTKDKLAECGFIAKQTVYSEHIDTVPFTIQETGGIHITVRDIRNKKLDNIVMVDIEDENLYIDLCFAYKIGNANPIVPLFMKQTEKLQKAAENEK